MRKTSFFSWFRNTLLSGLFLMILFSCGLKDFTDFDEVQIKASPEMVLPLAYGNIQMQSVFDLMGDDSVFSKDAQNNFVVSFVEEDIFEYKVSELIEFDSEIDLGNFDFDIGGVSIDFDFDYSITLGEILDEMSGDIEELKDYDGKERSFPAYTFSPDTPTEFEFEAIDDFETVTFSGGELLITMTNNLPVFGVNMKAVLFDLSTNTAITEMSFGFQDRYAGYDIYYTEDYFDGETFGLPGTICTADGSPGAASESLSIDLTGMSLSNQMVVRLSEFYTDGSGGLQPIIQFSDGMDFKMQLVDAEVESGRIKIPEQNIEGEQQKLSDIKISDDINLNKASLNSGMLNVKMTKTLPITGNIKLNFPSITKNGIMVSSSLDFATDDSYNFSVDLSNTVIDFTENAGNIFNTLFYSYNVVVNPTDGFIDFGANESFSFEISISDLDIQSADGDFGQMEVVLDESNMSLSLDFFDMLNGQMTFLSPELKLIIENSLSVPVEVALDLVGYNTDGVSASLDPEPFMVPYPEFPAKTSVIGEILINKDNSNIVEFISLPPTQKVTYGGTISMNPAGPPANSQLNHVEMDGTIGFDLEIEIPFQIATEGLSFSDTIVFDGSMLDLINSGELLLRADNGLPFSVDLELSFIDSLTTQVQGDEVQTLLLQAAQVDETGTVTAPSSTSSSVILTAENVPHYRNANAIIFVAIIASPEDGSKPAKLSTTNEIYLNVGLKAAINLLNE